MTENTNKRFLDYAGLQALVAKIKAADAAVFTSGKTVAEEYVESRLGAMGTYKDGENDVQYTVKKYVDDKIAVVSGGAIVGVEINGVSGVTEENIAKITLGAEKIAIDDADSNFEAENVEAAFAEVADMIAAAKSGATVTCKTDTTTEGMLKTYTFYQGEVKAENVVATVDIPKDFLVKSGSVVTKDDAGAWGAAGTYIELVLNVKEGTATDEKIYINVADLIEYVTSGSADNDVVKITVSNDHKVTASIADKAITKALLEQGVQDSLGKADTAVQSVSVNGVAGEKGENGAVTVTVGADKIEYKAAVAESSEGAGDGKAAVTVKAAIKALEDALGEGGDVASQIQAAIEELDTENDVVIASVTDDVVTLKAGVKEVDGVIAQGDDTDIVLAKVAKTGKAEDVEYATGKTVKAKIDDIVGNEGDDALAATGAVLSLEGLKKAIQDAKAAALNVEAKTDGHVQVTVSGTTVTISEDDIASAALLGETTDNSGQTTAFGFIAKEVANREAAIANLSGTTAQAASATNGLSLSVTQTAGVVTAISGDIETITTSEVDALFA